MRSGGVPARRSSLIGRDDEVASLADLALHADGRLVTVIGVGGVGKTSLAFEVGRRLRQRFPDGIRPIDLAAVPSGGDLDAVITATLRALGLAEQARAPIEVLVEHLEARQALLLYDNCEHVATAVAVLIDRLLDRCPYLRVLTTSRIPLRVRAETAFRLGPLQVPTSTASAADLAAVPSVELFLRRARAADQEFRLDAGNAAAVATICRRLDGLPLAIELAAARVAALSPAEIEKRLGTTAGLLGSESVGTPDRQQTLEAALAWSYDLLSPAEQAVFRRLSIFVDGWTLDAAEAVCRSNGDSVEVALALTTLVEHSLVVRQTAGARYRLLQPIAEFAGRRLDGAAERPAVALPHAAYFLGLAGRREPGETQPNATQLDVIAGEHQNCLAGIRYAEGMGNTELVLGFILALAGFWRLRGHLLDGAEHLGVALRLVGDEATFRREMALLVLADYERLLGRHDLATRHADEAFAVAEAIPDPAGLRTALAIHGDIATSRGDYATARLRYEEAWPHVEAAPHALATGYWHANVGYIELRDGRLDEAAPHLEAALQALATTEPTWYTGRVHCWLGAVQRRRGRLREAHASLTKGFEELVRYGARVDAVTGVEELARVALDERKPTNGALLLGAASALRDAMALLPDEVERAALDADIDRAREALLPDEYTAAWSRGRELSFEDVTALAAGRPVAGDGTATVAAAMPRAGRLPPRGSQLTRREQEVAALIAEGLTNPQIAERLFVSTATARGHVEQILGKLGLTSRVQVATWIVSEREKPVT